MRSAKKFARRRAFEVAIALLSLAAAMANAAVSAPRLVYKSEYAMGTVYEIAVYSRSPRRAAQAIDAAFREILALDHLMTNYDPQSDLCRLDRAARFHAARVPPDLFRVIKASLVYSRLSGGKYDVTVGPLVDAWKAAMRDGQPPSAATINQLRGCVGYQKIELIPPDSIELHSACMSIDLGSIGKGYAVDRAVEILRSYGVRDALVNAGGSTLYGMGSPPGKEGWRVRLFDPSDHVAPAVVLRDSSVSTSGHRKASMIGAGTLGDIIDPATAKPSRSEFAVSVAARTATGTDGLSTMLFLLGPKRGSRVVRTLPDTAALWISPSGETHVMTTGPEFSIRGAQRAQRRQQASSALGSFASEH
jgi:FAD:protein FMN transferase